MFSAHVVYKSRADADFVVQFCLLIDNIFPQELGMFMSCLTVVGNNGNPITKICKSSILEFK